ncbi:SCAR-like protein 2 isoform X1 [Typha latifolia]|uniref:SCAR-like protein 2 isoform X1 n=1 Tax=Typha latifolia TaxID=4733 RepID=UPI003C2DF5AF
MPLVRFEVRNEYGLGDPELYRGAAKREDSKAVLDGVAVAGLVGILRQLGDLAEFAADIFHDLHEQVTETAARGCKVLNRVQNIETALPSLEKAVQGQTAHIHFAYVAGCDWHTHIRMKQSHLLSSDLPRFMMDSYEECRDPPRLYLLDKFDSAGAGACLKRYSDPSYFKTAWNMEKKEKAENIHREYKAPKIKRKVSRFRNGEFQRGLSPSQQDSSRTRFASPSTNGQTSDNRSTPDMKYNPDLSSRSTSFGSKTRLSFVGNVLESNPSVMPDEIDYDKISDANLNNKHSDASTSILHDEVNGNGSTDDSQHDSLVEQSVPRSPSSTWDEKTEIVRPTSPISCDDIIMDRVRESESLHMSFEQPCRDHVKIENLGEQGIICDIAKVPVSSSVPTNFDEVTSGAENYMDALNTLESETETEAECQTKREVNAPPNCDSQVFKSGDRTQSLAAQNGEISSAEALSTSHGSMDQHESQNLSNMVTSDSSVHMLLPQVSDLSPNLGCSVVNDTPTNNGHDAGRQTVCEISGCDLSSESSISSEQTSFANETVSKTWIAQCSPTSVTSGASSTKLWTNACLFGLEPSKPPEGALNVVREETVSASKDPVCDISSNKLCVRLHNSAVAVKSDAMNTLDGSVSNNSDFVGRMDGEHINSTNESSLICDQLFVRTSIAVQPNDPSNCIPSFEDNQHGDKSDKLNSPSELHEIQDNPTNGIHAYSSGTDLARKCNVSAVADSPVAYSIEPKYYDPFNSTMNISSSFSGLAHRLLANTIQRKGSLTYPDDSAASGAVNSDPRKPEGSSLLSNNNIMPNGVVPQASSLLDKMPNGVVPQASHQAKEKVAHGSTKMSSSSGPHHSGQSSPPLEHMKISFHPMNGSGISKLKLEFSNSNLHENVDDLMFPTFQLLPGSDFHLADSGSESDDDTFCRSCPYSSEDLLSPHSYSNSELWEQEDVIGYKEHELYDDSHKIPSLPSISCYAGLEQMNLTSIGRTCALTTMNAENGRVSLESLPAMDLPGLDSITSLNSQQSEFSDSLIQNQVSLTSENQNEMPPPPPLPPMQWRMTKSSVGEKKNAKVDDMCNQLDGLQPNFTSTQQQVAATATPFSGSLPLQQLRKMLDSEKPNDKIKPDHSPKMKIMQEMLCQIRNKQDKQKINGHEKNDTLIPKELDEREELLHQIRNKTFNLRRTTTSKPSLTTENATNGSVVAILEKANAIRQAFVGSDEGGDDDSWSDM